MTKEAAKIFLSAFKENITVTKLGIQGLWNEHENEACICDAKNTGCDIDASGATTLSHVLKVNTSLTHIDLRGLDCETNQ